MDEQTDINKVFEQLETLLEGLKDGDNQEALLYAKWMLKKAQLRYIERNKKHSFPIIYRRIYWAHMGLNIGREEDKHRPVLIIRTEKVSPICHVVPLTTKRLNDGFWYHIDLNGFNNTALVEHFRTISKDRIDVPLWEKGDIAVIDKQNINEIHKEIRRMFGNEKENISRITKDNFVQIKKEIAKISRKSSKN